MVGHALVRLHSSGSCVSASSCRQVRLPPGGAVSSSNAHPAFCPRLHVQALNATLPLNGSFLPSSASTLACLPASSPLSCKTAGQRRQRPRGGGAEHLESCHLNGLSFLVCKMGLHCVPPLRAAGMGEEPRAQGRTWQEEVFGKCQPLISHPLLIRD